MHASKKPFTIACKKIFYHIKLEQTQSSKLYLNENLRILHGCENGIEKSTMYCYKPTIKGLGNVVPDKKIFSRFPYIRYGKIYDPPPRDGAFWPQWHNLVEVH